MKAGQIRRFREVEALSPACSASAVLLQGFCAQQRILVEDVRSLIVHATAMRAALRTTIATAARPRLSLPPPSPPPVSELRDFAGEFYAALAHMDQTARSAVAAPPPHHRVPETHVDGAWPPPASSMRRTSVEENREAGEEEAGGTRSRRRPAARRGSEEAAETLLVSAIKSIGGTGTMLVIALLINGISFAERIISSSMPSTQLFARVHPEAERSPPLTATVARPPEAGEKTFYAPLERVAEPVPSAIDGPVVSAVLPHTVPPPPRAATVLTAQTVHEPAPRDEPDLRAKPQVSTKTPVATPQPPFPVRKVVAVAARPEPPLAPVNSVPASANQEGDGLYVVVLSTHKDAGEAREEFGQLQKKYAAELGSKQAEVQVVASQTGSWHRLVATPASSKTAATEICSSLRSAGYGRCWVKQY
jgi:hypothetical protein